jgi:hypothetical protein
VLIAKDITIRWYDSDEGKGMPLSIYEQVDEILDVFAVLYEKLEELKHMAPQSCGERITDCRALVSRLEDRLQSHLGALREPGLK